MQLQVTVTLLHPCCRRNHSTERLRNYSYDDCDDDVVVVVIAAADECDDDDDDDDLGVPSYRKPMFPSGPSYCHEFYSVYSIDMCVSCLQ